MIAIICTAAMAEGGDKGWFVGQHAKLYEIGHRSIDMVDIAASRVDWKARLEAADIIFLSGGNTFYLLDEIRRSGFDVWMQEHIESKIFVGASAGGIVMTPSIETASIEPGDKNLPRLTNLRGLGFVHIEFEPHCDEQRFHTIQDWSLKNRRTVFAVNDNGALIATKDALQAVGKNTSSLYINGITGSLDIINK